MANTPQAPQIPDKVWVSHPTDPATQSNESPACHHRCKSSLHCKRAPPSAKGDEVSHWLNEKGAWSLVNDWNGQSHHCSDMLTAGRQPHLSILYVANYATKMEMEPCDGKTLRNQLSFTSKDEKSREIEEASVECPDIRHNTDKAPEL